jgi:hypothetical protein
MSGRSITNASLIAVPTVSGVKRALSRLRFDPEGDATGIVEEVAEFIDIDFYW